MKEYVKKQFLMVKILTIVSIFLLVSFIPMMGAINTDTNESNLSIYKTDYTGVNFHVTIGDFSTSTINDNGYTFDRISIDNCGYTSDYGKVELPIMGYYVAVPQGADISLNYNAMNPTVYNNYEIYPAQPPKPETEGYIDPPFTKNESFYIQNEFYPEELAEITSLSIMRGCRIARISVYPFTYNPSTKQLIKYSDIDISVFLEEQKNLYQKD